MVGTAKGTFGAGRLRSPEGIDVTRIRGGVSILALSVSMLMTLVSMGSLVYVLQRIPVEAGTPEVEDESPDTPSVGFVDPSLPPYWGQIPPLPSCNALPNFESPEAFAERVGDAPAWYPAPIPGGLQNVGGSDTSKVSFSMTNNQVEGVDEADIVKTDGLYVYTASGNVVTIAKAYPPNQAHVVVRIPIPAMIVGLFVNGDRLVVLGSAYAWIEGASQVTRIQVLDIADRSSPKIAHDVALGGWYQGSRMIGDYVYVAAGGVVLNGTDGYLLPSIWTDGTRANLTYADIGVLPEGPKSSSLTLLLALRITGNDPAGCIEALQSPWDYYWGGGQAMYVSAGHVYLVRYSWQSWWNDPDGGSSAVHRFAIDAGRVEYRGNADVPGRILNQFSMDEHDGYFRIATNLWDQGTNVYVLDRSLKIVGGLEGLAPGETMHSARFLGDRAYLVTFKKIDPFFVVDLSDSTSPRLLGILKIPGFSDYLHPYDENHVIGLGKDTYDMGGFAWFQGVKLSLFDVTDVANPRELGALVIGDRGTDSEAMRDHRAFFFDRERGLLVLPIDLAVIDRETNPDPSPDTYGTHVWQGVYVISVGLESAFDVTAKISHVGSGDPPMCYSPYGCDPYAIRRSLYIGDYLYTVSATVVGVHEIGSFAEVARIPL